MNKLKDFLIPFSGIKEGKHSFNLRANEAFFTCFNYSEVEKGDVEVKIDLHKHSTFLELEIFSKGMVEVMCDRCTDYFNLFVEGERKVVVKYGDEFNDDNPDIIVIPQSEYEVDTSHMVYETIILSIPSKRIHPEGECNEDVIKAIENIRIEEEKNNEDNSDPRWDALKNLK